jgi:hypothetical protein
MSPAAMKAKTTAPAPAPAPAAPQDPQTGGRFERLPDGSLRPLPDHPDHADAPAATEPTTERE